MLSDRPLDVVIAEERLGLSEPIGLPEEDRINVMGGSIAIGHPFGATGGRITVTLLNEMRRRDVELGGENRLVSVLFADIRGSTAIAEGIVKGELHRETAAPTLLELAGVLGLRLGREG